MSRKLQFFKKVFGEKTGRIILAILFFALFQGSRCQKHKKSSNVQEAGGQAISGSNPNTPPSPSDPGDLITLINQYRASKGMQAVFEDAGGDNVAKTWANAFAQTGKVPLTINGQDIGQYLLNQGLSQSPVDANWGAANGYATAKSLFDALLSIPGSSWPAMFSSNRRVGVGLAKPGNGNFWYVVLYN